MINCDFLDLEIYLLNIQASYLTIAVQFKWNQKIICVFPMTIVHIFSEIRHSIWSKPVDGNVPMTTPTTKQAM